MKQIKDYKDVSSSLIKEEASPKRKKREPRAEPESQKYTQPFGYPGFNPYFIVQQSNASVNIASNPGIPAVPLPFIPQVHGQNIMIPYPIYPMFLPPIAHAGFNSTIGSDTKQISSVATSADEAVNKANGNEESSAPPSSVSSSSPVLLLPPSS